MPDSKPEQIKPVNGHVLIELAVEKKSKVFVPENLRDRESDGTVLVLAEDCDIEFDLEPGSRVIFEKFADSAIDHISYGKDGERKVTLIKDKLIMGVWTNDK